jgi:SpoVK/Ycf46/Vps4 family AAA+-type ATPase
MNKLIIPRRFRLELELHIIKNFSTKYSDDAPLILGIHGPAGEGKTFQCEKTLIELGVKIFSISPGQFENEIAGKPSEELKRKYREASEFYYKYQTPAVLFINDLDLSIGHMKSNVQTTINTWLVVGDLMHLADFPLEVDGRMCYRIPIIITGNNFSALHGPLLRPGRTKLFEWVPTDNEKIDVLSFLFPSLTSDECNELLNEMKPKIKKDKSSVKGNVPLSFFSALKNNIMDLFIEKYIEDNGFRKTFNMAVNGTHRDINFEITFDLVKQRAISLMKTLDVSNHLN